MKNSEYKDMDKTNHLIRTNHSMPWYC